MNLLKTSVLVERAVPDHPESVVCVGQGKLLSQWVDGGDVVVQSFCVMGAFPSPERAEGEGLWKVQLHALPLPHVRL